LSIEQQVFAVLTKTVRRFISDRCGVQARALSYVSLLSLIPFLVVSFLVFSHFQFYPLLKERIFTLVSLYVLPEKTRSIVDYTEIVLKNARTIGFFGIIVALGMAFILIIELSRAINYIWKSDETGSLLYNFLKLFVIIVCAFILIIVTFLLQNYVSLQFLIKSFSHISLTHFRIYWLISLVLHWILLSVIYSFIPHGKMNIFYSFVSGVVSGSLWYLVRWGLNMYMRIIPQINILYGSLAFIPIFLLWIYFTWVIVLFGFELNYTFHFELK
jgi:membrane protein